jgi:uncharacterized phage protein (TIGR02218 family)
MKTASGGLIAHLASTNQFRMADLYTLTLKSGTVLRLTTWDVDITFGGFTFSSAAPFVTRGKTTTKLGLEVPTLAVTLLAGASVLVESVPVMQAIQSGKFDGAAVSVDRLYMPSAGDTSLGVVSVFAGLVSDVDAGRISGTLNCVADTEQFNQKLPRNILQSPCRHTLFGAGCELVKATFAVPFAVNSGSNQGKLNTSLVQADAFFDLGSITSTSGSNNGLSRTVKAYVGGVFFLHVPFPFLVNIADTFNGFAGCDHLQATCVGKFNNLVHFGGQPYVPVPENAL